MKRRGFLSGALAGLIAGLGLRPGQSRAQGFTDGRESGGCFLPNLVPREFGGLRSVTGSVRWNWITLDGRTIKEAVVSVTARLAPNTTPQQLRDFLIAVGRPRGIPGMHDSLRLIPVVQVQNGVVLWQAAVRGA